MIIMKFYKCPICGNIIYVVEGNEKLVKCCGQPLEELIPNTVDAATEKHVPVCKLEGDKLIVTVGEVEHPMTNEHYIMFIAQVAGENINIIKLKPNDLPTATFPYIENATIYSYCNLHGLWSTKVE